MRYYLYLLLALMMLQSCDNKKQDAAVVEPAEVDPPHAGHDSIYIMTKYANDRVKDAGWKVKGLRCGTWRHYNDDATLKSISYYYKGRRVSDLDPNDFNCKSLLRQGVFVMLPKAWEQSRDTDDFIVATKYTDTTSTNFFPVVKIMKIDDPAASDLQDYVDATLKQFRQEHPEFKLLDTRRYKILSDEAYEIFALMNVGETKIGYLGTYIKNGQDLYFVTCMAEDGGQGHFLKYLGVFNEITESVNFQ